jgi:hypothetical protein
MLLFYHVSSTIRREVHDQPGQLAGLVLRHEGPRIGDRDQPSVGKDRRQPFEELTVPEADLRDAELGARATITLPASSACL